MAERFFDLQRFADVIVGKASGERLTNTGNNTQLYGLEGNDTLDSSKSNATLIGGSGNDSLRVTGGTATLNGGSGADTFNFTYSDTAKISAVVEDLDTSQDNLIINYTGADKVKPTLNYSVKNGDVIITDSKGYLNVTLKGTREVNDYYDQVGNSNIWDILRITNQERENQGLAPLVLSQGLTDGAAIRAPETVRLFSHTRPNGTDCWTAVNKSYWTMGENIAAGNSTPEKTMVQWMNSTGHRANILNTDFKKLGVGYTYDSSSQYKYHWVQMFAGDLNSTTTVSTDNLLETKTTLQVADSAVSTGTLKNINSSVPSSVGATISNAVSNKTLNGTGYADSIYNSGDKVTISAGAANDTITNYGDTVKIDAGAGNDSIYSWSYYGTINGGAGNDTISLSSSGRNNIIQYASGDGNDTIYNISATDTISITGGNYTRSTVGNNVVLGVGTGSITVKDGKNKTFSVYPVPVPAGVTLSNAVSNKTINGTGYADSIYNSGDKVTISAGAANDTITNYGDSISIDAGAGNDSIYSWSYYGTINGGAGNDTISLSSSGRNNIIQYASGYGNDTIYNISATDTISITGGNYTRSTVGNNVVLGVGNGSITVKDGVGKTLNIIGDESVKPNPTIPPDTLPSGKAVYGTNGHDKITNSIAGAVIYGYGGNDSIYNAYNNVTIYGGDGADSVRVWYADNVSISGGSGNDNISLRGNNAIIDGGAGSDIIYNNGTGASISGGDGNDSIGNYGNNARLYVGIGDDTIYNSGMGASISGDVGNDRIYCTGSNNTIYGGADNDSIYVSNNDNGFVDIGTGNDTIKAWYGDNVSLKGGTGNDFVSLRGGSYVIAYNSGDGNDTVVGFDGNDTLKVYGSYSRSTVGSDVVVKIGSGSITLKDAKSKTVNISTLYSSADLLDADNFITGDTQLDSIANVKAAGFTDVVDSFQNVTQLVKQNTILTFGKK